MNLHKIFIYIFIFYLLFFAFSSFSYAEISTYSPSCILIEASTGKIVYEKDAYKKMYPASITKVMTAILTLENCNLDDHAIVSKNAVDSVPNGYSTAYLKVGEELTIFQLLNVLLIPSANDAAIVLSEHVAGSVDSFVSMMNTKASEIGCLDTNFTNPSGIHDENHYSTAFDLSLIGKYAMQNETFRRIVATKDYTLPATNKYSENNRYFKNSNELILPDNRDSVDNYYYKYCTGIKTGYTDPAKDCIIASSQKDGLEFILVILGADRTDNGLSSRYLDCINLFNYAFENFNVYTINEENSILKQIKILNGTANTKTLDVVIQDKIDILIDNDTNISNIIPKVELNPILSAPISKNSVIGKITYTVDGIEYTSNLLAGSDVEESDFFNLFIRYLLIGFALLLIFVLVVPKKKRKK